ncbi:MAG TPA: adenylyl-sulfate kinase [Candidatus Sulfobium mesophilum]|nr:adenylyl-sulfate kinase [Candidatus Sulfobium mesophilum]
MDQYATNVTWHHPTITKEVRWRMNQHKSVLIWFTGLSASGKSTIAHALESQLFQRRIRSYVLDGDNIRHGMNKNLGFSPEDRHENLRRIGELSKLFVDAGIVTITAFISPYRADRQMVRELVGSEEFIEVYLKCSADVCETRDPKGLYQKAKMGEIQNFTGVSSPYEVPENPELLLETDILSIDESVAKILAYLDARGIV